MSDYVTTTFAIAKIKKEYQNLSYKELEDLLNINEESDELEIREDCYEQNHDENGKRIYTDNTKYLYYQLYYFPKNSEQFKALEDMFLKFDSFIDMSTFEAKAINWYNGADMPLFET